MANNNFPGAAPTNYWEFPESDSTQHPVFSSHPILRPGEYYPAFGFTGATSYEQYPISSSFPSQDNSEFFDPLLLQVDLMSPQVNSGAELSAMVQESQGKTSHKHIKPSASLRCTYQSCAAKEEDRVFTGKDAEIAYKRHMNAHRYICHVVHCPRHTKGFSRQDNWKTHLKTHRGTNKCRSLRGTTSPEPTIKSGAVERRASPYPGRMERNMARKVHQDLSRLMAKAAQSLDSFLSYMGEDEDEDVGFTTDKCDEGEDRESDVYESQ